MEKIETTERVDEVNRVVEMDGVDGIEIEPISVITGEQRAKYLYWQLELSMARAKKIDLIVSFLMESGVTVVNLRILEKF